jgi:DNA-binding beta-propeller fold protein YncE
LQIFTFLVVCLVFAGCQGRERSNPLDPLNPDTGGIPDNLNAEAGDGEVTLKWRDLGFTDLTGYDLVKFQEETAETTILNTTPLQPSTNSWIDGEVINSHTYTYFLRFLIPGNDNLYSMEDVATPDPTIVWVVDRNSLSLRKISPDSRDIVRSISGLSGPWDLVIPLTGDIIWVADYFGGRARKYNINGDFILDWNHSGAGRGLPVSLGFNILDDTVWIGGMTSNGADGVSHITEMGEEIAYYSPIPYPFDIDVDIADGTVWVASYDGNAVYVKQRVDADFRPISGFYRPVSVSADPISGRCWIADYYGITVVNKDGDVLLTRGNFNSPTSVAVDASDGSCWVADRNGTSSVHKVDPSGDTVLSVGGFDYVSNMAVDYATGACWVTNVTDIEGEVVKISREGAILGRVGKLSYPSSIGVLP